MSRTLSSLRLIIVGMALVLAMLAAPMAHAQSVQGSGQTGYSAWTVEVVYQFTINVSTRKNGLIGGSIRLTTTTTTYPPPDCIPNCYTTTTTTRENYSVVSLSVTGNQASVWAKSGQTLHEFIFVDNGDGSIEPDWFDGLALWSGNIAVTP